jgi:hypothetical protein
VVVLSPWRDAVVSESPEPQQLVLSSSTKASVLARQCAFLFVIAPERPDMVRQQRPTGRCRRRIGLCRTQCWRPQRLLGKKALEELRFFPNTPQKKLRLPPSPLVMKAVSEVVEAFRSL